MSDRFATRMKFIPALHIILLSLVKNLPANAGDTGDLSSTPGWGRSPGVECATHSTILAWKILWTEEPGGLQSVGSQGVGIYWAHMPIYTIECKWMQKHPLKGKLL